MMAHLVLGSLWKLLPELLGQFGRIAEIGVVDVDVLGNDRFYARANAIG